VDDTGTICSRIGRTRIRGTDMAAPSRRFRVILTEPEVLAVTAALSEYIYLVEEGALREMMAEMEADEHDNFLTAGEASDLKGRLESLLRPRH
jgi:hypothetical protein